MPREFTEADKVKKLRRISPEKTPAPDVPDLNAAIQASLENGYLPCPKGWAIALKFKVPKNVVGNASDKLGLRISNCQLGCFKVDKNRHENLTEQSINRKALAAVDEYTSQKELTCQEAFNLAKSSGVLPMDIADAANWRHQKIRQCQLGCW